MAATPTQSALELALGSVPAVFRTRLVKGHADLKRALRRGEHDACGLRAGKVAEVLLRLLQNELSGTYTPFGERLPDVAELCRQLERSPKSIGPESFRVLIPRAISFVYTLRNKRDIGHVGGDLDANAIDSRTIVQIIDWCLCELMRIKHDLPLEEAQALLDAIGQRDLPLIWSGAGRKRVLDPSLSQRDQTLVLLSQEIEVAVPIEDLADWIEAPRLANYKARVLAPMHAERLIEWDRATETVILLPPGVARADAIVASKIE